MITLQLFTIKFGIYSTNLAVFSHHFQNYSLYLYGPFKNKVPHMDNYIWLGTIHRLSLPISVESDLHLKVNLLLLTSYHQNTETLKWENKLFKCHCIVHSMYHLHPGERYKILF